MGSIRAVLPSIHREAQFDVEDLLGILQGVAGVASGLGQKDPFAVVERVTHISDELAASLGCPVGSLESILGSLEKWLTFGSRYEPLGDSSDLDFDQIDIQAVPEMMQVG